MFKLYCMNTAVLNMFGFIHVQVDEMFREAPIKKGNFDYNEFTRILKHGKKDEEQWENQILFWEHKE